MITEGGPELFVKISDFGTCLKRGKYDNSVFLKGISMNYAAPENILHCLLGNKLLNGVKSDIWSLGVVFYRLFVRNTNIIFPWTSLLDNHADLVDDNQKKRRISREIMKFHDKKNKFVKKSKRCPMEVFSIVNRCLQVNPVRRPDLEEVMDVVIGHQKREKQGV